MFFLKHVLPLVIVSVLIGYVVARVGFPPPVNKADMSDSGTKSHAAATGQQNPVVATPAPASPAGSADVLVSRIKDVVTGSEGRPPAGNRDSYTDDINREIEAAVGEWSRDTPEDTGSTPPAATTGTDEVAAATGTTAGTSGDTAKGSPVELGEDGSESVDPVTATVTADAGEEEAQAATEPVHVAIAELPADAGDEDELAAAVTAEIEELRQSDESVSASTMSLEELLGARWTLGNEPAAPHLPSFVTSCKSNGASAECWSGEYIADPGKKTRTKTKSIIQPAGTSGFTIRYRNMVTAPGQRRGHWDKAVKQLDCNFQTQDRIRCENIETGQEIIYTKVTSEQFIDRFTLSSLAATRWYSGGRPAIYLPSGTTRCDSDAAELVCWTNARTIQSAQGPVRIKTKSVLRKTGAGTFTATYRNLITNAAGQETWEPQNRRSDCEVKGFERIVCNDAEGTHSFAKAVFEL